MIPPLITLFLLRRNNMKKELKALEKLYWFIVANGAKEDYEKCYNLLKEYIKGKEHQVDNLVKLAVVNSDGRVNAEKKLKQIKDYCEKRYEEENEFPEYTGDDEKYDREYFCGLGKFRAFKEILDLINKE